MAPSKIFFFLVISFFAYNTSNAANHYVDKNATGGNNGGNWTNAWQSFSAINWASIEPGDIIYISGGTDSTVYYEQLDVGNIQGTAANPITIRNSWETGHNGRVIIDGEDVRNGVRIGESGASNHVIIYGLEITRGIYGVQLHYSPDNTTLDSLLITNWAVHNAIKTQGNTGVAEAIDGVIIQNCTMISSISRAYDAIQINSSSNHIIRNNFIWIKYRSPVSADIDGMLAIWAEGFRIYNNIVICDSNAMGQSYIIRARADVGDANDSVIVYNNLFYHGGIWDANVWNYSSAFNIRYNDDGGGHIQPPTYIAHNTIITNNRNTQGVVIESPPTFVNNIVCMLGDGVYPAGTLWFVAMRGSSPPPVDSVRQNLIWREFEANATQDLFTGTWYGNSTSANNFDWATWTGTLGGTGWNEDPLFVMDLDTVHGDGQQYIVGNLQAGSPCIGVGEDTQDIIETMGLPWKYIGVRNPDGLGVLEGEDRPTSSTPTIGAYQYVSRGPDITPPEVTGATLLDSVTLRITFSEPLDPSTAQNPNNYSINNGITVVSVLLTGSVVTLTTSPHAIGTYTVTVSNVEDLAGNIVSPTANSADYDWTVIQDVTPPELIGVQIVEADKVILDFSEPLDASQVSNLGNYIISEQMQVLSAELNTNQTRICLTTDEHLMEHIYTIEIYNLTDLAGNVISSQANSAFYKKLDIGAPGYMEHLIECVDASATTDTNTSPQKTLDGLVNGDPDPNSRWAAEVMPQWIQFDLGAITDINLIAISFYNWNNGRIYEYSIQISNDENNWNEIVSNASSPSQEWTLNEFSPILTTRYVRIICESNNQANWAGVWEARIFEPDYPTSVETEPRTYTLKQNYPNPFNPSTTISYSIPASLFVTLKIYGVLGNEVATLVNAEKPVGSYEVKFDATGLPSGIYFYRLQAGNFVEIKKMVLLR